MEDAFKNFLKTLVYIAVPIGLQLISNALTQKREQEVFELKVQQAVDARMKYLLESGNKSM